LPDREEALGDLKDLPPALSCDEDTLVKVLRKLKRLVAAGPSGLTNDHILHMFPVSTDADVPVLAPLLDFVNKALAGDLCEAAVDFLTSSTLVALYKPDGEGGFKMVDGPIRHSALLPGPGDTVPHCVPVRLGGCEGRCCPSSSQDDGSSSVSACPCGAEAVVNAVRLYLDQVYDVEPAAAS
jgi:hypothetical protein